MLDILSTIAVLSEKQPDYSMRFGRQVIDCVKAHQSVEDWLMSRVIRDFGGKDRLGNLIQVGSDPRELSVCKSESVKCKKVASASQLGDAVYLLHFVSPNVSQ